MQNFGGTNKEHYGMLWYFWSGQLRRVFIRKGQPLCLPLGPSGLGKCKDWLTGVGLSAATTLVHRDVK